MRVRDSDVLDFFAAGLTGTEILQEIPYLEQEDLQALPSVCGSLKAYSPGGWSRPVSLLTSGESMVEIKV